MGLRRRDGVWVVDFRYRDPTTGASKRFRRSTGRRTTKRQAVELERAWRAEVLREPGAEIRKTAPFSGFARRWYQVDVLASCRPSAQRSTESILRVHLVPRFGDVDLRALDTEGIEGLRANLLEQCAPKTTANVMSVLGSLLRAAVRWGYLGANPMDAVPPVVVPPPPFDFWTAEETQRFLAAAEATEPRLAPFFRFGLRTGLRLGELFAVEDHDLNLEGRRVHVQRSLVRGHLGVPKSGRAREVPLTGNLVERLRLAGWGRGDGRRLFDRRDGAALTRGVVKRPFWRATEAAGLRRIRLHDMRHSYASQLAMAGVPITAIQRFLGHADVRTTQRYAHLAPDALSEYVERLEWVG